MFVGLVCFLGCGSCLVFGVLYTISFVLGVCGVLGLYWAVVGRFMIWLLSGFVSRCLDWVC